MTLVNSLSWPVSCCDGPLELQESTADEDGSKARMTLTCPRCEEQWAATVVWRKDQSRKAAKAHTSRAEVERIVAAVAAYYSITVEELHSESKRHEVVFPRKVAMYLCRTMTGGSYPLLGEVLHRDHSTVVTGVRRMILELESEPIEADVQACRRYVEERAEKKAA